MWENMGYPTSEKRARSCATWLVFTIFLIAAFLGIIYFDTLSTRESDEFYTPATCPAEITKEQAVQDIHLIKKN